MHIKEIPKLVNVVAKERAEIMCPKSITSMQFDNALNNEMYASTFRIVIVAINRRHIWKEAFQGCGDRVFDTMKADDNYGDIILAKIEKRSGDLTKIIEN